LAHELERFRERRTVHVGSPRELGEAERGRGYLPVDVLAFQNLAEKMSQLFIARDTAVVGPVRRHLVQRTRRVACQRVAQRV
jgi:hypothetical protein